MDSGLFDNHSHSYFSADSRMDIADAVRTAYERGLGGLCLTDHLDFDPPAGVADFTFDVPAQQAAIDEDVEFVREPVHTPFGTCTSFLDPDGNVLHAIDAGAEFRI